ncbi:hypothetical protein NQ317_001333 [Molorchus minor]|uniref:RNase H type-1 domain-containing protein n=1 Tax=Molorchus minor TaxID=1323400 RepID=A0ABQ9JRH6_9CUCU|nr:hypothetical protein NQ317_001333 [Molorchus minor]
MERDLDFSEDENIPRVFKYTSSNIPPWTLKCPKIILDCTQYKKDETNEELLPTVFYTVINQYDGYNILYTDGSKVEQGVGSALTDENETYNWTLSKAASIFTAELYAILKALNYVESKGCADTLICSDSLNPVAKTILNQIQELTNTGKNIKLVWTPSHVGIGGNEIADRIAKQATTNNLQNIKIRSEDIEPLLKCKITALWQNEWENFNAKLKEIKTNK